MTSKRRAFQRPLGERRYKKLFIVSVEGAKTEPQYFALFNEPQSIILVKCLKRKVTESSPFQALKRMESYLKEESLRNSDEAWIVIDKDNWTDVQLQELQKWEEKNSNHGLALSNPNFEYWLLLHFEDGKGLKNSQECLTRLKKHLNGYKKEIDVKKFTPEQILEAIKRAKRRHIYPSKKLPGLFSTSVYRLIERILKSD